jgi:hypothetical protein
MEPGESPKVPQTEASLSQDLRVAAFTVAPRDNEGVARGKI